MSLLNPSGFYRYQGQQAERQAVTDWLQRLSDDTVSDHDSYVYLRLKLHIRDELHWKDSDGQ